jgi:phosphomannomutase
VRVEPRNEDNKPLSMSEEDSRKLNSLRDGLAKFFKASDGFGTIDRLNYTDGIRIYFNNGDVAHVRPSGNADELRIYAVADTQGRADNIAELGVAEPDGILRSMARVVST